MHSAKEPQAAPSYSLTARSASGSALLLTRQVLCQAMNFCGIIFLARYLSIADYGFYGIVFFLFSFILNFGDVGLSASLLRQKEEPTPEDFKCVFSAQLTLSAAAAALFAAASGLLCKAYNLPMSHSLYFVLIAASLLITAFRAVPTARLERHLDFKWLSIIEIAQSAIYNTIASVMAYQGYGPLSFTLALLCRVIIGSVLVNIASRAPIALNFNWALIKKHLTFGLPYQVGVFINTLKDSISPIVVGLFLGTALTGSVNMACAIAAFPVMLLTILNRLFFPAFSRSINDKPGLEKLFGLSIRLSNALVAPLAIYILIMAEPFTLHVFGEKWVGAAVSLSYIIWPANIFIPTVMVCTCLLNAFGHSKTVLKFNLLWMALTLGLGTPLIFAFGVNGFGYVTVIVNVVSVIVPLTALKYINCRIFKEHVIGWLPAAVLVWIPLAFQHFFTIDKVTLVISLLCYYAPASALMYLMCRKDIRHKAIGSAVQ